MSASIFTLRSLRPLLAGSLMLAGIGSAKDAGSIMYGINYDVVKTDSNLIANCKTDPNAPVHQKFVVPRYGSPLMQTAARQDLASMRRSGFESVRSIVQLFPGAHPSGDLVNSGKVDDSVLAAIGDYVRD